MAYIEVDTVRGYQSYGDRFVDTTGQLYFWVRDSFDPAPKRLGYAYYFNSDQLNIPREFLVARFAVYAPGQFIVVPSLMSEPGKKCRLAVDWNESGVPIAIYY